MKNSLKKQMILFCMFLILDLLLVIVFIYRSEYRYHNTLKQVIGQQQDFVELYMAISDTEYHFRQYSVSPSEEKQITCEAYIEFLTEKSKKLKEVLDASWSDDLHDLIGMYTKEAKETLLKGQEDYSSASEKENIWYQIIFGNYSVYTDAYYETVNETYQILEQNQRRSILITVLVVLTVSGFEFWIVIAFARHLLNPIENLTRIASLNISGENVQFVPEQGEGETKVLCIAFNQMLGRIQKQMLQLKEQSRIEQQMHQAEKEHLEMQMKFLYSRINSHFLFNTLNVLSEMAWEEKAENTSEMADHLASYLRFSLENLNKVIPLQRELENIEDYFYILRKRFGGRIEMKLSWEESCAKAAVPSMVLQPMVENAYQHGVSFLEHGARIWVRGYCKDKKVTVTVEDNGLGMSTETIQKIYENIRQGSVYNDTNGIGLANIVLRLKKLLNCEAQLRIESVPRVKTKVSLCFPYMSVEQETDRKVEEEENVESIDCR